MRPLWAIPNLYFIYSFLKKQRLCKFQHLQQWKSQEKWLEEVDNFPPSLRVSQRNDWETEDPT